ncbi:MFS transporter [Streptomyces sp. NPDC056883]|uniref:MFS transporter n=1 Tax=Streptomyces sp. NPDC056883 TaxID=3345959 RepID=UPI0036B233CC
MSTEAPPRLSPQEFIDQNPLSRRQRVIVTLGLLMMVAEGLDVTIAGFVFPKIVNEWGTSLNAVTATVMLSVLAMAVGGVAAAPLADRYGRRGVIVAGTSVFGLSTAAMGLTQGIGAFAAFRIVACVGLGAVLPTTLASVADWTPVKRRGQMVALAFTGITAGSAVGGLLSAGFIPAYGWPMLTVVCGLGPLLLIPAFIRFVPESVSVIATREQPAADLLKALSTVLPGRDLSGVALNQAEARRRPQRATRVILSRQFAATNVLLWALFIVGMGVVGLLLSYLPLMGERMGLTTAQAGVLVAAFGWGGLVGQLSTSFALKRFDRFAVVAVLWGLSVLALGAAALWAVQYSALLAAAFVLGLCLPAANNALQAIAAVAYPPHVRATGMSWASGMGRLGALASGLAGGLMIKAGWTLDTVLLILVVPVALGILAALLLQARNRREQAVPPSSTVGGEEGAALPAAAPQDSRLSAPSGVQ